ncbi:hypothetical protein NPIL_581321 [Nephila pilipes]|uniref:Uncharacterized protein n=1 Tax=Nephila pilipes TaxID=299642 RepID=A0A8X6QFX2_NEPPI|nr:hypothetical protein NPIL_581321 [Nephila pilipes]
MSNRFAKGSNTLIEFLKKIGVPSHYIREEELVCSLEQYKSQSVADENLEEETKNYDCMISFLKLAIEKYEKLRNILEELKHEWKEEEKQSEMLH